MILSHTHTQKWTDAANILLYVIIVKIRITLIFNILILLIIIKS